MPYKGLIRFVVVILLCGVSSSCRSDKTWVVNDKKEE
jgi:hypothetical protein